MIHRIANQEPIEQLEGQWRIFQVPKLDESQPVPIAIGIRDDCRASSIATPQSNAFESRLVVWGLAMPQGNRRWTTFLAQASILNSSLGLAQLIPNNAKRTLAMTNPNEMSMIGFSGGDFESSIAFYRDLADQPNWKLEIDAATTEDSWSARLFPAKESSLAGIQVQLTRDHNENLTGILRLQPKHRQTNEAVETRRSPK